MTAVTPGQHPPGSRQHRVLGDGTWFDSSEPSLDAQLITTFPDVSARIPQARESLDDDVRSLVMLRIRISSPVSPERNIGVAVAVVLEFHPTGAPE